MMTTPQLNNATTQDVAHLSPCSTFSTNLTQFLAGIEQTVASILMETEHVELETQLNHIFDELWDKGYNTEAISQAKQQIVEDFLEFDEGIRDLLNQRQQLILASVQQVEKFSDMKRQQWETICMFEFQESHESLFGLGEDLVKLYNDLQRLNTPSSQEFREKDILEFAKREDTLAFAQG